MRNIIGRRVSDMKDLTIDDIRKDRHQLINSDILEQHDTDYKEWSLTRNGEKDEVDYMNEKVLDIFKGIDLIKNPTEKFSIMFDGGQLMITTPMVYSYHLNSDINDDDKIWTSTFELVNDTSYETCIKKTFLSDKYFEGRFLCNIFLSRISTNFHREF